jgi:hypothetical protein
MATVPRSFLRPLSASFSMGAFVAGEPSALDHEIGDDPVEYGPVKMAGGRVSEEVLAGNRSLDCVELQGDVSMRGAEKHSGVRLFFH